MKKEIKQEIENNYKKFEDDLSCYLINIKNVDDENLKIIKQHEIKKDELKTLTYKRHDEFDKMKDKKSYLKLNNVYKQIDDENEKHHKYYILNNYIKNVYQQVLYIYGSFIELQVYKYCKNNRDLNELLKMFNYESNKTIRAYKGSYQYINVYFKDDRFNLQYNNYITCLEFDYNTNKTNLNADKITPENTEKTIINIKEYFKRILFLKDININNLINNIDVITELKAKQADELKKLNDEHLQQIKDVNSYQLSEFVK